MRKIKVFLLMVTLFVIICTGNTFGQTVRYEFKGHLDILQVLKTAGEESSKGLAPLGVHFTTFKLGTRLRTGGLGVAWGNSAPLLIVPLANIDIFTVTFREFGTIEELFTLDLNVNYFRNLENQDNGLMFGFSLAF